MKFLGNMIAVGLIGCFSAGWAQNSPDFKGQFSAWGHFNPENTLPLWTGARYLPQFNHQLSSADGGLIDFEASANLYGNMGFEPFDSAHVDGDLKPYRLWTRYSTQQFELRAGLQKINFGSASLLRPLMWFDQLDPRDPLQLTDGVWGVLGRYYFLNNVNAWLWVLYGNKNPKGWESVKTNQDIPEAGGRFQIALPNGEAAVSYHYRVADSRELAETEFQFAKIAENRVGFDAKFDRVVGYWLEASWTGKNKNVGRLTHQEIVNVGMDYTFGLGNGLTMTFEQLVAAFDEKAFQFEEPVTFSLLNLSYPIGLIDNLGLIVYYDWTNHSAYYFVTWQKKYNNISLFLMGYINPKNYNIPTPGARENLYAGSGVQVMFVYNH